MCSMRFFFKLSRHDGKMIEEISCKKEMLLQDWFEPILEYLFPTKVVLESKQNLGHRLHFQIDLLKFCTITFLWKVFSILLFSKMSFKKAKYVPFVFQIEFKNWNSKLEQTLECCFYLQDRLCSDDKKWEVWRQRSPL